MVRKVLIAKRRKSKKVTNSNCTTLLCSFSDSSEGSAGSTGTISAAEKVSGIIELREKILKYAIHANNGKISVTTFQNVRLVQRSWFESTTKLLGKSGEHLAALTVDGNAEDVNGKKKRLDQLVKTFGSSQRLPESFLPVKLHLKLEFFRETNFLRLSACLTRLGSDLVELQLEYPKSGGTMPATFPSFSLPYLRKLSFQFSTEQLKKDGDFYLDDNRNGLCLLQSILNASESLKEFVIPFSYSWSTEVVPMGFKHLQLPPTLSFLDMCMRLKNNDLEILLNNQLPNLSHLTLQLHRIPFEERLLFKILEVFQKTLQTLQFNGVVYSSGLHTFLRLPLMEKLKKLDIRGTEGELSPQTISFALQNYLPQLTVVRLMSQTEASLAKWTLKSRFENVGKLSVSIVNEELRDGHDNYNKSPSFKIMTQLHRSFPNLWYLVLFVNISDLTSLKFLFQEMVQLQTLSISFAGNKAVLNHSSDLIDSILLGLPLRLVVALKEDPELLETMEFKGGKEPSIRNLSELGTLSLWTKKELNANPEEIGSSSLISNLLFRHAFLKMTKLWNLILFRKFNVKIPVLKCRRLGNYQVVILKFLPALQPSSGMQEEWGRRGRSMTYHA